MYILQMFIKRPSSYKLGKLDFGRELTINNSLRRCKGGDVQLRVHAGNLSKGIFEPFSIGVSGVLDELHLSLVELLNLFGKLDLSSILAFLAFVPSAYSSKSMTLLCRGRIFSSS